MTEEEMDKFYGARVVDSRSPQDRVMAWKTLVLTASPFFAHLIMAMRFHYVDRIPTAAVDDFRNVYLNPNWVRRTTDGEGVATLIHEVMHPAFRHFNRIGRRDKLVMSGMGLTRLSNIAQDYALNLMLQELIDSVSKYLVKVKLVGPTGWNPAGLYNKKYEGMLWEEIYDLLEVEVNKNPKIVLNAMGDMLEGMQPEAWEGEGRDSPGGMSEKEKDMFWKVKLSEAVIKDRQSGRGSLPGSLQKLVQAHLTPSIYWYDLMSRWIGDNGGRRVDMSYRRPSRRSESLGGLILATTIREGTADVVVFWDTSGSMNGREERILVEVVELCESMGLSLRVICIDSAIHSDQSDVTSADDIDVRGGGGSNFRPAFERLVEENYRGLVVAFTDGCIDVPNSKPECLMGVLWIIWNERGDVDPTGGKWGDVVRVKKDGLVVQ